MKQREHQHQRRRFKVLVLLVAAALAATVYTFSSYTPSPTRPALAYDCYSAAQSWPVFANKVEGVKSPFFLSIADLGTAERPNRNFQRVIKGKLFQKPAISESVQTVLARISSSTSTPLDQLLVVDVGANVGMATFAAAAMGFQVFAFEPVEDNVRRICDGVYLNRASSLVTVFHAAVSDALGNTTLHKVIGRLDNTAVSLSGAKLAFKSKQVVPFTVNTVTLDSMVPSDKNVALLKVDVQGWEYHVFNGAMGLLSRPAHRAPYIIFEDDKQLLAASNSSSSQVLDLLRRAGYSNCVRLGNDRHCSKRASLLT